MPAPSPLPSELARQYIGGLAHVHTRLSNYKGHYESDQSLAGLVRGLRSGRLIGRPDSPIQFLAVTEHTSNPIRPQALGRFSLRARLLRRRQWVTHVAGLPVIHGFEANILADGLTDLTPQLAVQARLVIASRHRLPSALMTDPRAITTQLIAAARNDQIDAIGHPLRHIEGLDINWKSIFQAAAAAGTAIEINLNNFPAAATEPKRLRLWEHWLRQLSVSGCGVIIGSDLHNKLQLGDLLSQWHKLDDISQPNRLRDMIMTLHEVGITPERVVNAEYDRFQTWLTSNKTERQS